ncbi:6452_t:CDS:2, partial [Dentiscutata erythropus]
SALVIADEFINSALSTYRAKHKMTSAKKQNECGFICSAVGLYAVAAEVKNHMGDKESSHNYLELIQSQFSHSCFSPNTPSELFYGRAGFLYTQKFISSLIDPSKEIPTSSLIKSVFDAIIEDGILNAAITSSNFTSNYYNTEKEQQIPLFWSFFDKPYVGAAHGFAGILTTLLQFPENCREYYKRVKETVDFILFNCRSPNGNWPSNLNKGENDLIQFCHGAPGICLLACKAYEYYKEEKYLKLAMETANYVYSQGYGHKGTGLCHGISGNAYVFLSVYLLTKDLQYFQWALEYAEVCTQWEERTLNKEFRLPDRPWSLWEGLGGAVW